MIRRSSEWSCLLTIVFAALCFATEAVHSQKTRLRPISVVDYGAATGLHRRTSEAFSDLNLQTQSHLVYGSPGDDGQLLLANMTLYAPDGLQMVLMERFEPLTSSVDCKGDDGSMSLTFQSEDAFNHALQEWSYINEHDDGRFLLIANHEGCGPDDQRQPYFISSITEDPSNLTTLLKAQTAPWSEIAGTYDIDFGQAIPYQAPPHIAQRGLWGDITNVGKNVLNAAQGNADLSKSVNFDVSIGHQGQKTNIYTDDKGRLVLDCINCFVKGTFQVTGHLSVQNFNLQDLTLTASPNNVQAELELEATITSSENPDSLQYTKELFSFAIPDAGIEVEGIFKLGAILSYDVGISTSFSGSATMDFGLQAGLPNSAQIQADIQNPDQSFASGFDAGDLTPVFDITKESASITLSAFSQPKLSFGIELIEVGNIDVALTIKLPQISSTISAEYDGSGVCDHNPGASKTGVKLDNKVAIEVDLQIDASLGDDKETVKPSWSKKLWGEEKPLGGMCFPLDIPGLTKNVTGTTHSALPAGKDSPLVQSITEILASTDISISMTASSIATALPSDDSSPSTLSSSSASILDATPPASTSASTPRLSAALETTLVTSSVASSSSTTSSKPRTPASLTEATKVSSTVDSEPLSTSARKESSSPKPTSARPKISPKPTSSPATKETSSSSSSSSHPTKPSATSTSAAEAEAGSGGEGGGCRMIRRFGKRMLVC